MSLSRNLNTREINKFVECDGNTAVRTQLCGSAVFRPSGLNIAGKITIVSVNSSTWTALPATALTDRNAICIQNRSGSEIKLNYDNGVSGYVGVVVPNLGERYYDITDNILIYAKSASGTVDVTIEEIS